MIDGGAHKHTSTATGAHTFSFNYRRPTLPDNRVTLGGGGKAETRTQIRNRARHTGSGFTTAFIAGGDVVCFFMCALYLLFSSTIRNVHTHTHTPECEITFRLSVCVCVCADRLGVTYRCRDTRLCTKTWSKVRATRSVFAHSNTIMFECAHMCNWCKLYLPHNTLGSLPSVTKRRSLREQIA